jgi:hypothetical protein
MGYGEYGGGGSVKWHVEHSDGDNAKAPNKKRAHGRDHDPRNAGAHMAVWINGVKQPLFLCEGARVYVAWGADAEGANPPTHQNPDDPDPVARS